MPESSAASNYDFRKIADEVVEADDICTAANFLRTAQDEIDRLRGQMQAGFARERKLAALFAESQK